MASTTDVLTGTNTDKPVTPDALAALWERGSDVAFVNPLVLGYHMGEVDRFADKLTRYFREGWPLSVEDVRTVTFTAQRGGYREAQVDLVLDAVVDVMLAVR